ncbi:pirin family protein [candidate division Kazan bacterium]|uniref:Pirin family protein n=1 Tax=candidate division Kazan bacterium TaxID=2202143 RepID=A0A420ZBB3_UNCK3|nr:MAG: pirin family protein [candidate division Kazan bacterium]
MNTVLHRANTRGYADHDWLKTYHTFSFAAYRNPERDHFGTLRVLNDDLITPGTGFRRHPHQNMEIISIPLSGTLEHTDNMGNITVIREGEIQIMSAGTGVYHSEYNKSRKEPASFLQIWIEPDLKNADPRYDQISLKHNRSFTHMEPVISPEKNGKGLWIHQKAWLTLCEPVTGQSYTYNLHDKGNGVYLFVIEGEIRTGDKVLYRRDGMGIWNTGKFTVTSRYETKLLLIEVPMK